MTNNTKDPLAERVKRLSNCDSYTQWFEVASQIDQHTEMDLWRHKKASDNYPYEIIEAHTKQLKTLIKKKDFTQLLTFIQESLHRSIGDLSNPQLYQYALCGTKHLISEYLELIEHALNTLCDEEIPGITTAQKLNLFIQAEKNFGRPALMLSGGGTFGIYHIGVMATLLEQDLIPNIISGTSMGSIAAGILATHTKEEILVLLAHPDESDYSPLKTLSVHDAFSQKSLLDDQRLYDCIEANIGQLTFKEGFEKTGREVSITVSPARSGQKPRILNYQTAPDVLIASAAKASCSVPGLFPASQLMAKSVTGEIIPYMSDEKWVDGSFATDIPRQRISRLHNVNYFIVSQANPHIIPFLSPRQKNGLLPTIKDLLVTSAYAQGNALFKVARRRLNKEPWRSWLNHASMLLDQDYSGDINIHPDFPAHWYLKFMKNPNSIERDFLLKMGEKSTWPKLAMIHDQTRVSRTLQACIDRLKEKSKYSSAVSVQA